MPRKSRTRGRATLNRRSTNSYMRSPRRVTFTPMGMPSRSLKFATLFLARQITGRWPVTVAMSPRMASIILGLSLASPQPTFTTTLSSLGICITLL